MCAGLAAWLLPGRSPSRRTPPQPVAVHFFFTPTCPDCAEVRAHLYELCGRYPQLQLDEHDLSEPENVELLADFYQGHGIPEEQWEGTLALFVGDRWWSDADEAMAEVESTIKRLGRQEG